MLANTFPLVSIGVPVYNEEAYLPATLESLLGQDYPNFEIIIGDNASTDRTGEICQDWATREKKIRYYRNKCNIGAIRNFNQLFARSQGDFFMWAGSHDLREPNCISACAQQLLSDPKLVMSCGTLEHIDEEGKILSTVPLPTIIRGLKPAQRLRQVLYDPGLCFAVYGLMRSDALRKIQGVTETFFQDFVLVANLALYGEFSFSAPTRLFLRTFLARDNLDRQNEINKIRRLLPENGAGTLARWMMGRFPFLQFTLEILRLIYSSELPLADKILLSLDAPGRWKHNLARELTTRWIPRDARQLIKKVLPLRGSSN